MHTLATLTVLVAVISTIALFGTYFRLSFGYVDGGNLDAAFYSLFLGIGALALSIIGCLALANSISHDLGWGEFFSAKSEPRKTILIAGLWTFASSVLVGIMKRVGSNVSESGSEPPGPVEPKRSARFPVVSSALDALTSRTTIAVLNLYGLASIAVPIVSTLVALNR